MDFKNCGDEEDGENGKVSKEKRYSFSASPCGIEQNETKRNEKDRISFTCVYIIHSRVCKFAKQCTTHILTCSYARFVFHANIIIIIFIPVQYGSAVLWFSILNFGWVWFQWILSRFQFLWMNNNQQLLRMQEMSRVIGLFGIFNILIDLRCQLGSRPKIPTKEPNFPDLGHIRRNIRTVSGMNMNYWI